MKKKKVLGVVSLTLVLCLLVTGCGENNATLENNHDVITSDSGNITADTLYEELMI